MDEASSADAGPDVVPVYPQVGSLRGRRLRGIMTRCAQLLGELPDPLPPEVGKHLGVPTLPEALRMIHRPWECGSRQPDAMRRWLDELNRQDSAAHRRLAFDELLTLSCVVERARARRDRQSAPSCVFRRDMDQLAQDLFPFPLTDAQRQAAQEVAADMALERPMARLLQGDVGSGKTAVAVLAMRAAVEAGRQAALMVPTEILAEQHLAALRSSFARIGWVVELLTGSMPPARRDEVRRGLASGVVRLVVGTHALLQETVHFRELGLVVIDEQHRFGVAQRRTLLEKGTAPHLLVMTATPIPRSMALTLYGDLDVSLLDELPPDRRPVTTVVRHPDDTEELFRFLGKEVRQGGRAYVVFPLIDGSPEVDAASLTGEGEWIRTRLPGVRVALLHGRLAPEERQRTTNDFREGRTQVLLATSLVEVGMDVPEATLMVVASPERFGLAQLHQLRGRVGRGRRRSWCVLLADPARLSADQRRRLEVFCRTGDGFAIAEADLRLRGAGEITGLRQWGTGELRLADLARHAELVSMARRTARQLRDNGRLENVLEGLAVLHPVSGDVPAG